MDITTATPREIDSALAEIYTLLYSVWDRIDSVEKFIEDQEKGLAKAQAGDHSYSLYTQEGLDRLQAQRADLQAEANEILAEASPYEDEYVRRGRWSRFYLVTNNGGHIHSSRSCSTCFPTTRFGWLPEYSGQDEAGAMEALANQAHMLCSVCFPNAPVEWTKKRPAADECEGSGQYIDRNLPHRVGYYTGNWAECPHCHDRVTVTKGLKFRKHKRPS